MSFPKTKHKCTKYMKQFLCTLLCFVQTCLLCAQTVKITTNVEDDFLCTPLIATVQVLNTDSTVAVDSVPAVLYRDRSGRLLQTVYTATVNAENGDYILKATLLGYEDVYKKVPVSSAGMGAINVPTLRMHKMLRGKIGEVTVTATRLKMYYKGDTLVYDASAFKLPQGSMLDDLIKQMPGVTMNDAGEIFVNGRKVEEMLLSSRTFMNGNKDVLMKNLPYYTVKDVKVYEMQTDKSKALGYDVEKKRYVMDVNLKKQYSRGYIANAEGAAGTKERWLARAFLLGFTDRMRLTLLGNVNNVNERCHIGESGSWTPDKMPTSLTTTRSGATELAWYAKGDSVKEILNIGYTSTTDRQNMRKLYEQFLDGGHPTSQVESYARNGARKLSLTNQLSLLKPFYIYSEAKFEYTSGDNRLGSQFLQYDDSLTSTLQTRGMGESECWNAEISASGAFNVGRNKKHIDYFALLGHNDLSSKSAYRYDTRQYVNPSHSVQRNSSDMEQVSTHGLFSFQYGTELRKNLNLSMGINAQLSNLKSHDCLYHPDTLLLPSQLDALQDITDFSNSFDSKKTVRQGTLDISLSRKGFYALSENVPSLKSSYDCWKIALSLPVTHDKLDYQRGALDTLARQTTVFANVTAAFRKVSDFGKQDFRLDISHKREAASLLDRISYRDDSSPLIVKLGNPDLRGTAYTTINAQFYEGAGKTNGYQYGKGFTHQQMIHAGVTAKYYHRLVSQSVAYNPANGVYTYMPRNVRGAYTLQGNFDLTRAIDEKRYWTWQTNTEASYIHSIDHAMFSGETESHENEVNTLTLHENAWLQFSRDKLNIRVLGDVKWRHSEGHMHDFSTLNAVDFRYGVTTRYTLPYTNTSLSADGTIYSRKGYGSESLNTDDFVVNASVSQPFLKGILIAKIEVFDLLHQLSATQYEVNAQGRTETWYESLPHYVMLHLIYHWNKSPKRK